MNAASSESAFFEAVRTGNDPAVEAALSADRNLLHARVGDTLSPVLVAAFGGHLKLASRLAALAAETESGLDVFDAATTGHVATVRAMLTDNRASVDDGGPEGYTALHLAASFGQLEMARMLLGRGADPNVVALNAERVTPLHCAVSGKHRDVVGLLLALGASANAIQKGGETPLHTAAINGDEAIVDMLLLRGADPTRATDAGKTAIDLANENGHGALANVMRQAATNR